MNQLPSSTLSSTSYTAVGTLHLHVDGGEDAGIVTKLLDDLKSFGLSGKFQSITDVAVGTQRQEIPTTYQSHTPGISQDCEHFEFFSTIGLSDRAMAISTLQHILPILEGQRGIVVEVEHVVANIDKTGQWQATEFRSVDEIASHLVGLQCSATLPFEIHHCIDVYGCIPNPLNVRDLVTETRRLGMSLGGWFAFTKEGRASYRSNAFIGDQDLKQTVSEQYELLAKYIKSTGLNATLKTVIEHVLGVWKIT